MRQTLLRQVVHIGICVSNGACHPITALFSQLISLRFALISQTAISHFIHGRIKHIKNLLSSNKHHIQYAQCHQTKTANNAILFYTYVIKNKFKIKTLIKYTSAILN